MLERKWERRQCPDHVHVQEPEVFFNNSKNPNWKEYSKHLIIIIICLPEDKGFIWLIFAVIWEEWGLLFGEMMKVFHLRSPRSEDCTLVKGLCEFI